MLDVFEDYFSVTVNQVDLNRLMNEYSNEPKMSISAIIWAYTY